MWDFIAGNYKHKFLRFLYVSKFNNSNHCEAFEESDSKHLRCPGVCISKIQKMIILPEITILKFCPDGWATETLLESHGSMNVSILFYK